MTNFLHSEFREGKQKSEITEMRRAGRCPAVVYGKSYESKNIMIDTKQFRQMMKSNNGMLEMEVGEEIVPVLVQDIQSDPIAGNILHVDFHQVEGNQDVKVEVPLDYIGVSPGTTQEGGVLQIQKHAVTTKCKPHDIPSEIAVNISDLHLGDMLKVRDIQLPSEKSIQIDSDPNEVLVKVLKQHKLEEQEVEAMKNSEDAAEA
ncbi:50S ribosomal protein L25 [Longirhabdus pacifica]|uniref:50S ribosomal protein L25 n=1 Tax=Longirhabdus pacifica TaxID=2305227 RepID=UPI001008BA19|nr:50S ribosomal protein L25 [Longirhabdus pacifica]